MFDISFKRDISDDFMKAIDEVMIKERDNETPRNYLGASGIAYECERQVAYSYYSKSGPDFPARVLRIFDLGHHIEEIKTGWIKKAYNLIEHDEDGKQFGFSMFDGKFKGHCDGIFISGQDSIEYPSLWECKGLNNDSWNSLKTKGLRQSHAHYYGQVQLYMGLIEYQGEKLNKNPCVFTALNKNSAEMHVELVRFNQEYFDILINRAERLLDGWSAEQFNKISRTPTDIRCRMCKYNKICWKNNDLKEENEEKPSWL